MKVSRGVKLGCLAPIIVLLSLIGGLFLLDAFLPSGVRRALPESATDIQEYYSDSWNGDFVRLIKARLPEGDYHQYAKALNLSTRFDESKHSDIRSKIDIGAGDAPAWWDPPQSSSTTYFDHVKGDDYVKTLKYSNGTVYLFITSW
jgi:hypothetical protein